MVLIGAVVVPVLFLCFNEAAGTTTEVIIKYAEHNSFCDNFLEGLSATELTSPIVQSESQSNYTPHHHNHNPLQHRRRRRRHSQDSGSGAILVSNAAPGIEGLLFQSNIDIAIHAVADRADTRSRSGNSSSSPLVPKILRDAMLPTVMDIVAPNSEGNLRTLNRFESFNLFEAATFQSYDPNSDPSQQQQHLDQGSTDVEIKWLKEIELDVLSIDDRQLHLVIDSLADHPCVEYVEIANDQELSPFELESINDDVLGQSNLMTMDSNYRSSQFLSRAAGSSSSYSSHMSTNDKEFGKQWHLQASNFTNVWNQWQGPPGDDFIVGVLDTGCDINHPDLKGRFWKNPGEICGNGIDDDGNGYIDDCYGYNFAGKNANLTEDVIHGTPVSGAITANTNNNFGIAGACWGCKIMCARTGEKGLSVAAFAEAMNYAVGWGVKVVNYSGTGARSKSHDTAISKALQFDTIVVTAAGNDGCDVDDPRDLCPTRGFPGRIDSPNVINVGSVTNKNEKASYSNYGKKSVHLFAPSGLFLPRVGDFGTVLGTSFSSPTVTAAVALLRSYRPAMKAHEIRTAVMACSQEPSLKEFVACGGALDVMGAFKKIQ